MSLYEIGPLAIVNDLTDGRFVYILYTFTFCGFPNHRRIRLDKEALDINNASFALRYPTDEYDAIIYDADRPFAAREISKFMNKDSLLAYRDTHPGFFKGSIVFSDGKENIQQIGRSDADLHDRIIRRLQAAC